VIHFSGNHIFALVLAAGCASRFGATKQLSNVDSLPLVRRATDAAVAVCGNQVVLVVGHDWQAVAEAGQPAGGFLVCNDRYSDGLGSSIAQGVRALRHVAGGVLVMLADQPLVTAEHLRHLMTAWSGAADEIVATAFGGSSGPPALFGRDCFEELASLTGDSGGKHLLSDARFQTRTIDFEAAAVDIDTPEDLRQISRNARS
jgi:CTP:molybdopterin cytidylyltransferase MocA